MAMNSTKAFAVDGIFRKGHFKWGRWGNRRGTPAQLVHDGDTVSLGTPLNFSSRFLGIDAHEISFTLRADDTFVATGDARWKQFWTSGAWRDLPLKRSLASHLAARIGNGEAVAANHHRLAKAAERALTELIVADMQAAGTDNEGFEFFLAFGYEMLDGYGRLLCYLHPERSLFVPPAVAPVASYNERLLATGAVVPYFIFPNLQPFMAGRPFDVGAIAPRGFWSAVEKAGKLAAAREAVARARDGRVGVFAQDDPLIVLPYELRYLARANSQGPDRYVIDLGRPGHDRLIKPHKYWQIDRLEDRLFVPPELVPLFVLNGWKA